MELKQKNDIRSLFHFLDRSLSLDTQITGNKLNRLRSGNNQYCSLRRNEAPEFELSLHVEVEDPVREVDGGLTRTNIRQKDMVHACSWQSPLPGAASRSSQEPRGTGPPGRTDPSQLRQMRPIVAADMYCEETCSVLAVLHDLKAITDESPIAAGPLRDFTSVRPVRLSWWGTEGEVASFMWPLPPLQTYVETSAFLGLWHECLQAFLGNPSSTPVPDRSEGGAELRLFELQMVQLAKRCGERCHGKQPGISSRISSEGILQLTQLWIVLGTYEVLRCTEPQDLDLKSAAGDGTMSSEASFSGLLQFSLESLQVSQSQISKTQIYRSQRILNEWICRILQLLQPEHVTPEIAGRFFLGLSVSTQQWLQQELDSVRRAVSGQRRRRLSDIWRSGKRELWKQLNTVQGEQPLLILLDVPEAYTKKDMRTDVKELRLMMEQMKAAQQFESARQELRTQLAFAEMQAATDEERALESYQSALERARALAKDRSGNVEFLDEFVTLAFKIIDVLRGRRNWSAIEAIYPGLLSFWKETLKSSGSDNSRQRAIWQRVILLTDIAIHLEQWRAAATLSQESLEDLSTTA
ncbi:MAG UNVERIFIED_CONTAM: hypothetical protein LVR18_30345 [Planctomycetaceae bacterium]|jgi:hypothetical protein